MVNPLYIRNARKELRIRTFNEEMMKTKLLLCSLHQHKQQETFRRAEIFITKRIIRVEQTVRKIIKKEHTSNTTPI